MRASFSRIDDIDHEALHFVVVQTRYLGPGNDTERTGDGDIRVVSRCGRRRCSGMEILQHRIAKALQDHRTCKVVADCERSASFDVYTDSSACAAIVSPTSSPG